MVKYLEFQDETQVCDMSVWTEGELTVDNAPKRGGSATKLFLLYVSQSEEFLNSQWSDPERVVLSFIIGLRRFHVGSRYNNENS